MKKLIFSSLLAVLLLQLCAEKSVAQDNKIYDHTSLKTPPSYPGGIQMFYDFLAKTMQYPKAALANNTQGTTYLTFIVEKDGSLSNIAQEGKALGSGTDEEAIRSLKLSKRWNPGMENGKVVRTKYNIPVRFVLPGKTSKSTSTQVAKTKETPSKSNDETIYSHVSMETPPTYPGGLQKFYDFVSKNLSYPKIATEKKVKGTVYISFNIEKDGSLSNIKTEGAKLGSGTDEEAIRVLKLSKRWNPGMENGKVVRTKYNIPIKFTM